MIVTVSESVRCPFLGQMMVDSGGTMPLSWGLSREWCARRRQYPEGETLSQQSFIVLNYYHGPSWDCILLILCRQKSKGGVCICVCVCVTIWK